MQLAPLTHEAHGPPRETAGKKLESRDVNGRPVFPVRAWKCGGGCSAQYREMTMP